MGKKIISAVAAVGLLAAGAYLGNSLSHNNSASVGTKALIERLQADVAMVSFFAASLAFIFFNTIEGHKEWL